MSLEVAKNYTFRLINAYGSFIVPVAMFIVFNSTADSHTRDPEKLSLLWLKFNQATEAVRSSMFPAHQSQAGGASAIVDEGGDEMDADL